MPRYIDADALEMGMREKQSIALKAGMNVLADAYGLALFILRNAPTNADRIRSMSDEKLAVMLESIGVDGGMYGMFCESDSRTKACDSFCDKCILEWLRQPAEE